MKKVLTIALVFCSLWVATAFATSDPDSPQAKYIERYAALAVAEMYRSGVPASITLAQGLLESRYGLSDLAVKGNNHFGIKCHNWNGGKMYHDDDRNGECFRMYKSPEESFRDHSDFLRYRDRYKFLFDLEPTDYEGWAYGLKKAGYATDPAYPKKLIRLIEEYGLHEYDLKTSDWAGVEAVDDKDVKGSEPSKREKKARKRKNHKEKSAERPESPNAIEQARPLDMRHRETLHFALSRQMYSLNGVPFVRAAAGETYKSIAAANNLFLKEILRYNDLDQEQALYPGTVVYLQSKKKQAAAGLEKHIVEDTGETLWDISQRYGIRLNKLCKLNGVSADKRLYDGEVILLRK